MGGLMQRIPLSLFVLTFLFPAISNSQQPTILYVNRTDPSCGGNSPRFTTIQVGGYCRPTRKRRTYPCRHL